MCLQARVIMGLRTGHYRLDMRNLDDVRVLKDLFEHNQRQTIERRKHDLNDTSQFQDWSAFRNETFNGRQMKLTTKFLDPVPSNGTLEFDFASTEPPPAEAADWVPCRASFRPRHL